MRGVELGSHLVEFTVIHALLMVPHPYHFATRAGDLNEPNLCTFWPKMCISSSKVCKLSIRRRDDKPKGD